MSTRTNIIIKDGRNKLIFYRHSDGYPKGTVPSLSIFLDWVIGRKIRDNLSQAAGWLIILGAIEYGTIPKYKKERRLFKGARAYGKIDSIEMPDDDGSLWKVGAYEPTYCIHGDIQYLYIIDLQKKTLKCYDSWAPQGKGLNEVNIDEYRYPKS